MPTAPWPTAVTMTESHPPLTTPWHVPESCTWTYDPTHTDSDAIAWLDLKPRAGDTTLSCYPDGMFDGNVWGVFSPASCPRGWTTVDISVETGKSPDDALTTATCCSSNYVYQNGYCGRHIPYVLAVPITYITIDSTTTYSILTESTTTLMDATIAVHTILAEWQRGDEGAIGITDGHDVEDDDNNDYDDKNGLSVDAKAGIAVGVGVAVLLISAILFLIIRRRRGMAKSKYCHEMGSMNHAGSVAAASSHGGRSSRTQGGSDTSARHYRQRSAGDVDPPPSYDAATDTSSLEGGVECREVGPGGPTHREAEIIVLREQKEAIQRRIEELEGGDGTGRR